MIAALGDLDCPVHGNVTEGLAVAARRPETSSVAIEPARPSPMVVARLLPPKLDPLPITR